MCMNERLEQVSVSGVEREELIQEIEEMCRQQGQLADLDDLEFMSDAELFARLQELQIEREEREKQRILEQAAMLARIELERRDRIQNTSDGDLSLQRRSGASEGGSSSWKDRGSGSSSDSFIDERYGIKGK
jgi:hypothetical protein